MESKFLETENRMMIAKSWGNGNVDQSLMPNGYAGSVGKMKNLEMDRDYDCTTMSMYLMPLNCMLKNS